MSNRDAEETFQHITIKYMRNFTLHKFLATLLMAVCSATLSVAQNVAKIGTTEYATLEEAVNSVAQGKKGYIYILADASFDDLRIEGKQIIINLQNHTVTGNKIDVYGTEGTVTYLKILDSTKDKNLSVDATNNYKVSYTNSWRKRSIPTHSEWLYPLTFDAGKGLKEA